MYEALITLVPGPGQPYDWRALSELIPSLATLDACPQDPSYHAEGNVGIHTRMVCDELVALPCYAAAPAERRFVLFYAALLHDIAKPSVTREENGRLTSKGHSLRGATDSRILLWRQNVPFGQREAICRIIRAHQEPFVTIAKKSNPAFVVHKLSHELNLQELSLVAEADARGRRTEPTAAWQETLDAIALFRELAQEEGCYEQPRAMANEHTRLRYFRHGDISPDYPFYQASGSPVLMLSGLPASGKNTWLEQYHPGLPVVSFDDARAQLGLRYGQNDGAAAHRAVAQAKELLRAKQPFAWNATHLSKQMRDKTLDLLYAYQAEVDIVYLEQPASVLFSRNHKRDSTLSNKALEQMLFRWEVPLPTEAHRVRYLADAAPAPRTRPRNNN